MYIIGAYFIKGGETPINNSIVLYKAVKEAHPDFISEIEEKVAYDMNCSCPKFV